MLLGYLMKRARTYVYLLLMTLVALQVCSACNSREPVRVNLKAGGPAKDQPAAKGKEESLRIGMGGMITPKDGYVYYQRLQGYIEKKLGRPVQLVDRETYDEMNNLMEAGGVDAAFVCAGPYIEGKDKFGMELLAMPLVKGRPTYQSYIIVHKDSPIQRLADLRGKAFAFSDPKSNSGKIVPTYMLARMHETPDSFFAHYAYTYGHDQSIRAVADKLVDGAAVDSLIWEYAAAHSPRITDQTRIILKSDPYGIPPVVVRPGLAPELKQRLQEILISAANDAEGREILKGMVIDRFVAGDDSNYDSIRTINSWIASQQKQAK